MCYQVENISKIINTPFVPLECSLHNIFFGTRPYHIMCSPSFFFRKFCGNHYIYCERKINSIARKNLRSEEFIKGGKRKPNVIFFEVLHRTRFNFCRKKYGIFNSTNLYYDGLTFSTKF